jgi:hypothetical protein
MSSQLTGLAICRGGDESLRALEPGIRPIVMRIGTANVRDTLGDAFFDERCAGGEPRVATFIPDHGDSNKPRAGNGNTDRTPGSDSYQLPCGHQVDRCSFARCRPAPHPFAETSCPWAQAPSPPTSRNGGKLRTAGIARRAFCSPTFFAPAIPSPRAPTGAPSRRVRCNVCDS